MSLKGTNVNNNNILKMAVDEMKKNEVEEKKNIETYNLQQAQEQVKSFSSKIVNPEIASIKQDINTRFQALRGDTYNKLEDLKSDSAYVQSQEEQVSTKPLWKKIFRF